MAEFVEWQILASLPHAKHADGAKGGDAAKGTEDALVYRFEGPLFFSVASTIFDALERIDPPPPAYVIDLPYGAFHRRLSCRVVLRVCRAGPQRGRRVVVAGARSNVRRKLIANQPFKHIIEFRTGAGITNGDLG